MSNDGTTDPQGGASDSSSSSDGASSADTASSSSDAMSSADSSSSDSSSSDSSSSDGSSSDSSSSDSSSSDSSSSDSSSSDAGSGSDGSSASSDDQTPATDLALDTTSPASTDADSSFHGQAAAASGGDTGATATAEGGGGVSVGDIIAIGTTAAKIMAASAPDFSMKSNPASILPKDVDPLSLSGWAADPHELDLPIHLRNKIHFLICTLPIVVQWRFGGSLKGVGAYITAASVFLDSGWDIGAFYKCDIDASFTGPRNIASPDQSPIAAVDVQVQIRISDKTSPMMKNIVLEGSIQGDGGGILKQRPG